MTVSISTHVLDTGTGRPAIGVPIELLREGRTVATGATDGDGRVRELATALDPGRYELVFHPRSPFFARVAYEIALEDGHYHVPLLISPYSCVSYRGS
jgi:5-hydroxyisourate hydrolase